jgi:uncharacterized protein YcgI (DUF1989 family)
VVTRREETVIPAREGRAFRISAGERLRLTTPHGSQAADFFAFRADDVGEWLSPMHTWTESRSLRPHEGHVFLSRYRRPMLTFLEDGARGFHDWFLAACDGERYRRLGYQGHHPSCAENLALAMRELGHEVPVTPQPVNFFTNTEVRSDYSLAAPGNPVPSGSYVVLEALADLVCAVSSCPFDLDLPDWSVNAAQGSTELVVEIVPR